MNDKEKLRLEWKTRINDFKTSNLSMKKWCDKNGVKVHQLQYWLKKYQNNDSNNISSNKWIEASINDNQDTTVMKDTQDNLLIIKVGKFEVNIKSNIDSIQLKEVIKVLIDLC